MPFFATWDPAMIHKRQRFTQEIGRAMVGKKARFGAAGVGTMMAQLIMSGRIIYPLVNIHKTMENHHFEWVNQL
jgi:hypothetical protein